MSRVDLASGAPDWRWRSVRHDTAAERVRRRIAAWIKAEGHGSRKRLAEAVRGLYGHQRSASWVTDVLDGPEAGGQDLRLRDLDAVAAAMNVPPGELVAANDRAYVEVTPSEHRLLCFYRGLPDVVRHHLVHWLEYVFSLQETHLNEQANERDRRTAIAKRVRTAEHKRVI